MDMRIQADKQSDPAKEGTRATIPPKLLGVCPVCGSDLQIRELHCQACHIQIRGSFESPNSPLMRLSAKDTEFVVLFVRSGGNIKEMEKALGLSYPTVRGILDGIIERLGKGSEGIRSLGDEERRSIISRLEKGEIDAESAARLLRGEAPIEKGEA